MKFYLVFVYFLVSITCFARSSKTYDDKNNPNVQHVKSASRNRDTATINWLIKEARNSFKSSPEQTIFFAKKSLSLSLGINFKPGVGYSLLQIGHANYFKGRLDSAKANLDEAILVFSSLNDKKGLADSYIIYGQILNFQADYKSSIKYLSSALEIAKAQKYNLEIAEAYHQFGLTYFNQGKLASSLDAYYQSLFVFLKVHDKTQTASLYNNIGDVLQNLEEYPKALEYYKKALKEALATKDLHQIGNSYENIGEIKLAQKNFNDAASYLSQAIRIANKIDNKDGISYIYTDLGLCYAYENNFALAKTYLDISLGAANQNKILYDQAYATISYATVLNLEKDFKNAETYALQGKELAARTGNIWFLTNVVRQLYKSYAGQKKFETAFKYSSQYNDLKDSLKNAEGIQKLTSYDLILNFNEKQQQLELHQHEKDIIYQQKIKQQRLDLTFIAIIVLMAIIAASYYIQKNRQQKTILTLGEKNAEILLQKNTLDEQTNKLNSSNELKDTLIGILAHDLRAPLSTLNGLFYLLVDEMITHEEMLSMIPPVVKQLEYTSDFLDTLLFWINSQVENAGQATKSFYLRDVVASEIGNHREQAIAKGIHLFETVPDDLTVFADPDYIKIVIRNLIGNALKFSEKDDTIEVGASIQTDDESGEEICLIKIKDTGIGMSEAKARKLFNEKVNSSKGTNNEKGSGMAMLFCRDLIEKCNGKIWVTSIEGKGTQFNFTLPMSTVREPEEQIA